MKTVFPCYVIIDHGDANPENVNSRLGAVFMDGTIKDALSDAGFDVVSLGTTGEFYEAEEAD